MEFWIGAWGLDLKSIFELMVLNTKGIGETT